MKVLVTGATGFIGLVVCRRLRSAGYTVVAAVRRSVPVPHAEKTVVSGPLSGMTDWSSSMAGIDAVVHLAGVAHTRAGALQYDVVNVAGTAALARAASFADVRRFVFMSSVKAGAEYSETQRGEWVRVRGDMPPRPQDAYGRSKLAAERVLYDTPALEPVVLRPPLVYGPGQKGNLAALTHLLRRGVPLPFRDVQNLRGLVHVENLASAVLGALEVDVPPAAPVTLSDVELSTPALIRALASNAGVEPRLFSLPESMLVGLAAMMAQRGTMKRLLGTLVLDSSLARDDLGWTPDLSIVLGADLRRPL